MRCGLIALTLLGGCFIKPPGPDEQRQGIDGGVDGRPVTSDALCTPWSAPSLVSALSNPANDNGPALSPDGTLLVFTSQRTGGNNDLWYAQIAGSSVGLVAYVTGATNDVEYGAAWANDGTRLYFMLNGAYQSQSYASGSGFGQSSMSATLASLGTIQQPAFYAGDLGIIYTDGADLYQSTRASTASSFDPPQPITALNTGTVENDPTITPDGLTLYFTSMRSSASLIYRATRPTRDGMFSSPQPVAELGQAWSELDVAADDTRMFLTRDANGNSEIYMAQRTCQ